MTYWCDSCGKKLYSGESQRQGKCSTCKPPSRCGAPSLLELQLRQRSVPRRKDPLFESLRLRIAMMLEVIDTWNTKR